MRGIRQLCVELRRAIAGFEPERFPVAVCGELAEELGRAVKACETAAARAAARAARGGDARDAAARLAKATGTSTGRARAAIDTLEKVKDSPETQDALLAGEVSSEQAAEIVSAPDHEEELLDLAKRAGSGPVRRQARKRNQENHDPDELHEKRHRAREFVHWEDKLGMVRFRGALPPEIGHPLVNRLDRATDRLWRQARREGRRDTREQLAADAFYSMIATGDGSETPAAHGKTGTTARWRADVVFVLAVRAYVRGHTHPGEVCHILGGGPVPVSVVRQHAADAFVKAVVHDGTKVVSIVHYGRSRPALLQSVLDLGDPPDFDGVECAELGCERRDGLEWDHDDPVANGGPTSKENMVARCWPHHQAKTERDRNAGKLRGRRARNKQERGP